MTKCSSRGSARGCVPEGLSAALRRKAPTHFVTAPAACHAPAPRTGLALLPLPGAGARCAAILRARQTSRTLTAALHREEDWYIRAAGACVRRRPPVLIRGGPGR